MRKRGINPITIRSGKDPTALVLARAGVGTTNDMKSYVMAMTTNVETQETTLPVVLDHAQFIAALGYLFPSGELDQTWDEQLRPAVDYRELQNEQPTSMSSLIAQLLMTGFSGLSKDRAEELATRVVLDADSMSKS